MNKGVIYILTNPSFPQYVKIGYATDVKQRLDELNRSSAVPFAFRVYATYEVDSALSDKKLHSILDKLNPELRSTEEVDGKRRIREFYAMTPEDVPGGSHKLNHIVAVLHSFLQIALCPVRLSKFVVIGNQPIQPFQHPEEYSFRLRFQLVG